MLVFKAFAEDTVLKISNTEADSRSGEFNGGKAATGHNFIFSEKAVTVQKLISTKEN